MIIDLQRRIQEAGRIRIGAQVAASNGRTRPAKLDTFRLTSIDQRRIAAAADLYGGTVAPWNAPSGRQWEVITKAVTLDVIVPPSDMAFSQHYEMWSAGGCQRRCDGVTETLGDRPCLCDPDARECAIHTRLSVMLRDLAGLGVWRIDTSGYYAAVELGGAVQVVQAAAGRGVMLPARLRLEPRTVKRQVDGKPQTRNFAVPVLDIDITPAQLIGGAPETGTITTATRPQIDASPLTPVPADLPTGPRPSIAAQSAPPSPKPKRANAAPSIPPSGRQRGATATTEAPITGPQLTKLGAIFTENEITDRDVRLRICSSLIERELSSSKDLTKVEATSLIDSLESLAGSGDLAGVIKDMLADDEHDEADPFDALDEARAVEAGDPQ
ncbi:MAG: hypothetical protein ACRDQG_14250 [Pseudonocardiaceae bacterium]